MISAAQILMDNLANAIANANVTAYVHTEGDNLPMPRCTIELDGCQRIAGLPGIFDINGRVVYTASLDDNTRSNILDVFGNIYDVVADLEIKPNINTNLNLYFFSFEGDDITEDDPLLKLNLNWTAKASLIP